MRTVQLAKYQHDQNAVKDSHAVNHQADADSYDERLSIVSAGLRG